ncbi:MAG TPA: Clp protease N-terminal domain-containing protein [Hyphomicrobiaceae bacterium]|nr:Clp protease N-terminal domain-containing protein [Hyphomicrobiaceae bacterium]
MPQSFADQLRSIPMSPNLGQSLERAHRSARDQQHRLVTLEHLLLALTEDTEAAIILQSANVDLARLSTDVSGYLGRLLEDMRAEPGTEPRPDAEMLRVLQAAATAAQQSRRKQIDGAIVLAAIVGDGKSPAAGLLKALGMTFEEAIRALQRANTKARLKPLAKPTVPASASAPAPPGAASAAPQLAASTPAIPTRGDDEPPTVAAPIRPPEAPAAEAPPAPQPLVAQSPDEILAAARARIQQRAARGAKTEPAQTEPTTVRAASLQPGPAKPAGIGIDAQVEPVDPVQTRSLTAAIEAAMASSGARGPVGRAPAQPSTAPAPSEVASVDQSETTVVAPATAPKADAGPPTGRGARPTWTPPPDPRQQATAPPPPPGRFPPPPLPARQVRATDGPRRPPLPPLQGPPLGPPPPGPSGKPARAPWPEGGEPVLRPPLANGSLAEAPTPPLAPIPERPGPGAKAAAPPWPIPGPRGGAQAERGLIMESVPRRMRVGVPATAEVKVPRAKLDAVIAALNSRGTPPSAEAPLVRTLSVRLAGQQGYFWVEPEGAETHWADTSSGANRGAAAPDEVMTWRWTIVPRRRGRARLALMVSAQTVGRDGSAMQVASSDRAIEVKVAPNRLRRAARLLGWVILLGAGIAIGHLGQKYLLIGLATAKRALAMIGG